MQIVIDIPAETYKAISEWDEPKTKYAAEYMLYQFVKNGKRIEQTPCTDAISRSEAIRIASGYCHWSNIPKELEKLPSVNPIPCEDAISRQEAIDAMATWDWQELYLPIHFKQLLEDLPSVSTEKTGHWKKIKSGDKNFPESIVCSRCGYENSYINEWNFNNEPLSKVFKTSKYCPNCGAKMVEPQESE